MLQVGRKLEFLLVLVFFLFTDMDARANIFLHGLGACPKTLQHLDKQTVVLRKRREDVGCFDRLSTLSARAFHRALEELVRLGGYLDALSNVLAATFETFIDKRLDS